MKAKYIEIREEINELNKAREENKRNKNEKEEIMKARDGRRESRT